MAPPERLSTAREDRSPGTIDTMTAPATPNFLGVPARFFLAAVVAVGLLVGAAATASAASSPAAQNVVGASTVTLAPVVGPSGDVSPATSRESYDSQAQTASATGVAADSGAGGISSVLKGQAGVDQVAADIEAAGGKVLGSEITVDAGGVTVRPDLFVETPCGVRCFVEVKTGPYAKLNPNQGIGYPAIQNSGFVPRGANAANAGLIPGATYGPMPVWTVYVP